MATNTCAACGKPIGIAFLMCAPHWHLVPRAMQTEVYRTWGAVKRGTVGDASDRVASVQNYRAARDAAVNHARKRIEEGTPHA